MTRHRVTSSFDANSLFNALLQGGGGSSNSKPAMAAPCMPIRSTAGSVTEAGGASAQPFHSCGRPIALDAVEMSTIEVIPNDKVFKLPWVLLLYTLFFATPINPCAKTVCKRSTVAAHMQTFVHVWKEKQFTAFLLRRFPLFCLLAPLLSCTTQFPALTDRDGGFISAESPARAPAAHVDLVANTSAAGGRISSRIAPGVGHVPWRRS